MSETTSNKHLGFIQAIRSEEALELIRANKNAFVLLYIIARRARWTSGFNRHNLQPGQALIGDIEEYDMTPREYRTAKKLLEKYQFATFKTTNDGTIATLTSKSIFDINQEGDDKQSDTHATNARQSNDKRPTTNKEREEGKKGEEREGDEIMEREIAAGAAISSSYKLFIELWMENYQSRFQSKYLFQQAKDGTAIKRLLASTGKRPGELMIMVKQAWSKLDRFHCRQAVTIAGFASRYNEIQAELLDNTSSLRPSHYLPPVGTFTPEDNLKPF